MKRLVYLYTVMLSLIFSGCTGVKSVSVGLENESFLSFYSSNRNLTNIDIDLRSKGNSTNFSADVNRIKRNSTNFEKRPSGKVYSISPGSHELRISNNGKLIYSKKIFISNQETKIIKL